MGGGHLILVAGKDPAFQSGGVATFVRAHALAAVARGWEPHIYCTGSVQRNVATDFGVVHHVRSRWHWVHRLLRIAFTLTVPWNGPPLAAAVRRAVADGPRTLMLHGFGVWGGAAVTARSGLPNPPPCLVSAFTSLDHEFEVKTGSLDRRFPIGARARSRLERLLYRRGSRRSELLAYGGADLVGINYAAVRRQLDRRLGAAIRFHHLPYASDAAFRDGEPVARRPASAAPVPRFVTLARHDERKGLPVLLAAFALMRRSGLRFEATLAGDGALMDFHRRLAIDLGIQDVVRFVGHVDDVLATLREADVFALPSLQEGSGSLALLEAAQVGLPLVATAVDGLIEDVDDGVNGLLVPPGDAASLAGALSRLATDAAFRARLGAAARRTFEERFSAPRLERALGDLYGALLNDRDGPCRSAAS